MRLWRVLGRVNNKGSFQQAMVKCNTCKKSIFFGKKCYSYPGNKKDPLKITPEKVECWKCFTREMNKDERPTKITLEITSLMSKGDYKEALKILNGIFDKNLQTDWYSKGNLLQNLNKRGEALKCYDQALKIDTHYTKAWYRKGWIFWLEG